MRKKKLLRVIFRTFDENIWSSGRYKFITSLQIELTKIFTIPRNHQGFKYDHVEILTPKKQRFSIRMEKSDGIHPVVGVYLIDKDGFDRAHHREKTDRRYKLIFLFEITDKQEEIMYKFINTHKSEKYGLNVANWNVFISKIISLTSISCLKKLKINHYENETIINKKWDCVTLIIHLLSILGVIPEFDINGKTVDLLGVSSFNFANMLIEMYKNGRLPQCIFVISTELQTQKNYKDCLDLFYKLGSRVTRTSELKFIE